MQSCILLAYTTARFGLQKNSANSRACNREDALLEGYLFQCFNRRVSYKSCVHLKALHTYTFELSAGLFLKLELFGCLLNNGHL